MAQFIFKKCMVLVTSATVTGCKTMHMRVIKNSRRPSNNEPHVHTDYNTGIVRGMAYRATLAASSECAMLVFMHNIMQASHTSSRHAHIIMRVQGPSKHQVTEVSWSDMPAQVFASACIMQHGMALHPCQMHGGLVVTMVFTNIPWQGGPLQPFGHLLFEPHAPYPYPCPMSMLDKCKHSSCTHGTKGLCTNDYKEDIDMNYKYFQSLRGAPTVFLRQAQCFEISQLWEHVPRSQGFVRCK